MKANEIKLNESQLRKIVSESIRETLNEFWGNSSAPGTQYDPYTGNVTRSQGGAFGHNGLDDMDADRVAYNNRQARMQQNNQEWYKQWCYNNYKDVMAICPGYMNGGEYEKAYHYING